MFLQLKSNSFVLILTILLSLCSFKVLKVKYFLNVSILKHFVLYLIFIFEKYKTYKGLNWKNNTVSGKSESSYLVEILVDKSKSSSLKQCHVGQGNSIR